MTSAFEGDDAVQGGYVRRLPGITVAGIASIGAGAVHAAAIGIHAEHPQLARIFVVVTVLQLGAGLLALQRPRRGVAWLVVAVNSAAVAGWVITRITGISWIDGLEVREAPQFADTACAALGATAAGAALAAALVGWRRARPARTALPALLAAALVVPAMFNGGTHVHATGHVHSATSTDTTVPGGTTHDHGGASGSDTSTPTTVHDHGTDTTTSGPGTPTANWPRPWDPTKPIDLSGVPGVTPEQQARATKLVEDTLKDLPHWADTKTAAAEGYVSIGDAATGVEHYIKNSLINDNVMLDPTQPESLVYKVDGAKRILAGAMFIVSKRAPDDPSLTNFAGPLMTWHEHDNLCWTIGADGKPKVVGVIDAKGNCAVGVRAGGGNPMVHVWIIAHPCGVFAALEGIGAGTAAVPDNQRTDVCTAHDHTTTPATVPTHPYDPTKPIDLSGVPGVTPEQQAAAENLVAENVVRLPQWADYKVAEAAGFHSIGDGSIGGFEHFINWSWINDKVWLDPDHPESLVYQPQADGTKKLVSAMYMLPSSVALADVPNIGGALMQWHVHDNLCFSNDPVAPRVVGITSNNGTCPAGQVRFPSSPMIHVWITPNACGPFAALEGVAAGQILPGQERLCDHVHGDGLGS